MRLPDLPVAAHHLASEACPLSVHRGRGVRARILFCDGSARALGIRPGLSLAAAQARAASLRSLALSPRLLDDARRRVVGRLLKVSPRISVAGPDSFWAEPLPSLDKWCAEARAALSPHLPLAIGLGSTATIAHAAACSIATGHRIIPFAEGQAFLDASPVEVLELTGEARSLLAALGIRRVAELRALDPVSLGMRFGPAIAEAHRRAEGIDPRRPFTPRLDDTPCVTLELDSPIERLEALSFLLAPAAEQLLASLRPRDEGPTHVGLELTLDRLPEAPPKLSLEVMSAAPLDDARVLLELLRTRLERVHLPAPIIAFRLEALCTSELRERTRPLLAEGAGRDPAAHDVALQRLKSRLGDEAVRRAGRVERGALLDRAAWADSFEPSAGEALPWRRLHPPAPLTEGTLHLGGRRRRVLRMSRIERVSPDWWRDAPGEVELMAWAEVEGPMLVLLHGHCTTDCDDHWEAVAWVD